MTIPTASRPWKGYRTGRRRACVWLAGAFGGLPTAGVAQEVSLRFPEAPFGRHIFYATLLEEALRAAGHSPRIEVVPDVNPQRCWLLLQSGGLDVYWGLQSAERDKRYTPVAHGLTNGLIGQRVMLIPEADMERYAKVTTLAEFRATGARAVFAPGWFDAKVWAANALPFEEIAGSRANIIELLRSHRLDYFPRGANEVLEEARFQPRLAIEPHLLLVYARDFRFYLSASAARHRAVIEDALQRAERSGLKKRLIEQFFGPSLVGLNLERRTRIELQLPKE